MKIVSKIVNSFWVKIVSIIVIVLDFTFLIVGYIDTLDGVDTLHLHTWGLILTCIVDIVLGAEILLHFYYLYKKNIEDKVARKAASAKMEKKIETLESSIEHLSQDTMVPLVKQWVEEANKMFTNEDEIAKYVSTKYNEKVALQEVEIKKMVNELREKEAK
ncbi:MAG: hypothetical protein LBV48_02355 [Mycoplasmataceae bacterium]|nr:hypothetical protein [Mycoplasmataceae bacterium]